MIDATVIDLARAMADGVETSRGITEWYLDRIARLDRDGPGLNAVIEVNPDALAIADALDVERRARGPRGPLHGIPVLLKDNIETGDRMMTTAGSLALEGSVASEDSGVARRLRAAGAVILGKANLSEWANFRSTHSISGWSSRGGQTRNPYALDRNPCGSSSGSAVAVSADLCAVAVGTETDGSIICPAQANGIVGIKPTMGLVSRYGNVSTTYTLDTIGPMAGSVMDAAIVLGVIAGRDERDPATWTQNEDASTDYMSSLNRDGLNGARIGIHQGKWEALTGAKQQAFGKLLAILKDAGATIVDVEDVSQLISESDIDPVFFYECKSCMNAYLATLRSDLTCTSVQEIIEFNQRHASQALKYGQPMLLHVQNKTSGRLTEPEYLEALAKRERAICALDQMFDAHQLSVLLCTQPEIVAPITGFPSMSIPIGCHEDRIPIGAYWIARRYDETTLLRIAFVADKEVNSNA